jgi:hypothetical protein
MRGEKGEWENEKPKKIPPRYNFFGKRSLSGSGNLPLLRYSPKTKSLVG